MVKCKNCRKELEKISKSCLCEKCQNKIELEINERDAIANPSAQKLDEINSQFNIHNTMYKYTGE